MSAQHTPGEWSVLDHQGVYVLADLSLTVAMVSHQIDHAHIEGRVQIQNARLIAAAPDLLAFADSVVALLSHAQRNGLRMDFDKLQILRDATAVVSKATGSAA